LKEAAMRQLATALAIVLAFAAPAAAADAEPQRNFVAVWGQGDVRAVPDTADVSAGVVTQEDTAAKALAANSAAMDKVMKAIAAAGIAPADVQTQGVNVSPVYGRQPRTDGTPQIGGYRASNIIAVKVRDLGKLGAILDTLVTAGVNEMHGVRLTVGAPEKLLDGARTKAMADARRKALLYAEAAGAKLGRVTTISEESAVTPVPRMMSARADAAQAAVPIAPGEVEIKATVRVTFALE
jgi:uncharacterized protein YggE